MISCSTGLLLPGWLLQNSMVLLEPPPLPEVAVPVPAQAESPAMPAAPAMPRNPRRENSFMGGAFPCGGGLGSLGRRRGWTRAELDCDSAGSALDGAGREALDHLTLEEEEQHEDGQHREHRAGHDRTPVRDAVVVLQEG